MDLLQHYLQLASYDSWANREALSSLRAAGTPPARSQRWMAHILAAEHLWLARLLPQQPRYPVWPELSLEQCEDEARQLSVEWKGYLARGENSLEQEIRYKNSKGESWASLVRDVLTHVFMHSAYHRGQIAADMRQAGFAPASTDFIHGVRQGLVE